MPACKKGHCISPEIRIAILIHPDIEYYLAHVYNFQHRMESYSGLQLRILEGDALLGHLCVEKIMGKELDGTLSEMSKGGGGKDVIIGDLNARHMKWDITINPRGMEILNRLARTR